MDADRTADRSGVSEADIQKELAGIRRALIVIATALAFIALIYLFR